MIKGRREAAAEALSDDSEALVETASLSPDAPINPRASGTTTGNPAAVATPPTEVPVTYCTRVDETAIEAGGALQPGLLLLPAVADAAEEGVLAALCLSTNSRHA